MAKLGVKTEGKADGVEVLKQGFNVDPLLQKQADCISVMTYTTSMARCSTQASSPTSS